MGKWLIFQERGFVKISTEVSESGQALRAEASIYTI